MVELRRGVVRGAGTRKNGIPVRSGLAVLGQTRSGITQPGASWRYPTVKSKRGRDTPNMVPEPPHHTAWAAQRGIPGQGGVVYFFTWIGRVSTPLEASWSWALCKVLTLL